MMSFILSLLFVAFAVLSALLQGSDNPLKKVVSPGLTAFCALIVLVGTLSGNVPLAQGLTVFIALLLLAASDTMFEQSVAKPELFPVAMIFGVISGFTFGIFFNVVAFRAGVPVPIHAGCLVVGLVLAALVYSFLKVDPSLKLAVYVYLVQAVILLAGGLACLFAGQVPFAVWGILIFISDSLVGIRAFPNPDRRIGWLSTYRVLLAILVIYYPAQYAMVLWAN
jgi:hypothetical protein